MRSVFLILQFFVLVFANSNAQNIQLTPEAEISVVVADPGTRELFEVFGHPAIRVYDPSQQIDLAFNYGIFDFNQPYFYLNFTRGYLNYMVQAWPYPAFENAYISENRSLKEYVLNLSNDQKQEIFDFLANNVRPENRNYFYDYFYDNCATRIWDVFENSLGEDLHFDESYVAPKHSFRTLVDSLTVNKPWGDFGIDLCLGLPMDKKLTSYQYMYLPEFLGRAISKAIITIDGNEMPFTKETNQIYQSRPQQIETGFFTPNFLFWTIFMVVLLLSIVGLKFKNKLIGLDIILLVAAGLVGLLLFVLWAFTDHRAASNNLNIIWANPLYLFMVIILIRNKNKALIRNGFLAIGSLLMLFLITWPVNPQGINISVIPIVLTLAVRAFAIWVNNKEKVILSD